MTPSNTRSYFRKQHIKFFTISKPKSFSLDDQNKDTQYSVELVTSVLLNERYKKIWDQM